MSILAGSMGSREASRSSIRERYDSLAVRESDAPPGSKLPTQLCMSRGRTQAGARQDFEDGCHRSGGARPRPTVCPFLKWLPFWRFNPLREFASSSVLARGDSNQLKGPRARTEYNESNT